MINESEIRIGNLVYYGKSIRRITAIGNSPQRKFVGTDNIITEFEAINLISLTPEILEKCGFYAYKTTDNSSYWVEGKFKETDLWQEVFEIEYNNGFRIDIYGFHIELTSLHQLQNLYFALTGEELKVEL